MTPNPYAPPSSAIDLPAAPAVFALRSLQGEWTVWSVVRDSWSIVRRHWVRLLLPCLMIFILNMLQGFLTSARFPLLHDSFAGRFSLLLGRTLMSAVVEAGWVGQLLLAAQGQRPGWASYRAGLRYGGVIAGVTLFQRVVLDAPSHTFLMTGEYQSFGVTLLTGAWHGINESWIGLARCIAIAEGLSVTASLKRAWSISNGCRKRLVRLGMTGFGLNLLGMALLLIGGVLTDTVGEALGVVVYVVLRQREAQTANEVGATLAPTSVDSSAA